MVPIWRPNVVRTKQMTNKLYKASYFGTLEEPVREKVNNPNVKLEQRHDRLFLVLNGEDYNEVIKAKSNWEIELPTVDLKPDLTFVKKIRDIEEEEKQRKEAHGNSSFPDKRNSHRINQTSWALLQDSKEQ